jgi:hypothetical protein
MVLGRQSFNKEPTMNLFARMLKALHHSRQLQADAVIRRYSHLIAEVRDIEPRPQPKKAPARLTPVRKTLPACVTACLALAASALINTPSTAGDAGFAAACALRETSVITAIEERGEDQTVSHDRLAYAGFKMLTARRACYEGHTEAALWLYDEILNVELAQAHQ